MIRRLRDQGGFSLPELLVGMSVGMVVIFASFGLMERAFVKNREVVGRTDASQRARLAIGEITRQLRSQVCVAAATPPIVTGSDSSITFYADLGDGSTPPQQRTITYDPTTATVTEYDYNGTGMPPATTFGATPDRTRVLVTDTTTVSGIPFLRYYAFATTGTPTPTTLLTTPLASTDRARTVRIAVSFLTRASGPAQGAESSSVQDDAYLRTADPTNLALGTGC